MNDFTNVVLCLLCLLIGFVVGCVVMNFVNMLAVESVHTCRVRPTT